MREKLESGFSVNGVKYTILRETKSYDLKNLLDIYVIDKRKAKIIYEHRKSNSRFYLDRLVLFETSKNDFRFVKFVRRFGVSKTNIIYHREREEFVVGFKNGKFYQVSNRKLVTLNIANVCHLDDSIKLYLIERFGWLRNLIEDKNCHSFDLNVIYKNKLFNSKKCLRYFYKVPYPVAKMLSNNHGGYNTHDFIKIWKEMKKVMINVENLNKEFFTNPILMDTTKMAAALGYKVNCSWSKTRLKNEHDRMAKEIVEVVLEFEELRVLNINPIFIRFAEFSGYYLLKTNRELIEEGKLMSHCVGTYSGNVNSGNSGIFRVFGHTLELRFCVDYSTKDASGNLIKKINIGQYMGFSNKPAPKDLYLKVVDMVNKFNLEYLDLMNPKVAYEEFSDDLQF